MAQRGVSIPLRYADNGVSGCAVCRTGVVSIPLRYADNAAVPGTASGGIRFQFLLGTLITDAWMRLYTRCWQVSIPLRYADNAQQTVNQSDHRMFQFLLGTLITYKLPNIPGN